MCHTIAWFSTCAIILCSLAVGCAQAADYHVSPAGRDANPGTAAAPWQTIAKVNTIDLQPADRVLFEGGKTFAGTIELDAKDSGSQGSRVEYRLLWRRGDAGHRADGPEQARRLPPPEGLPLHRSRHSHR